MNAKQTILTFLLQASGFEFTFTPINSYIQQKQIWPIHIANKGEQHNEHTKNYRWLSVWRR